MIFKTKTNFITLRERKSRYLMAIKNPNKEAKGTALAIISSTKTIKSHMRSITFDQGSEFKRYEWIQKCLGSTIYFCEPASPHQKGGIENGNGLIRLVFQRDCDAEKLTQKQIDAAVETINHRPLKCLGYETPYEVFQKEIKPENMLFSQSIEPR